MALLRWRPIIVVTALLLIGASCGNSKGSAGDTTLAKFTAPSDGGASHRATHDPISGVPGVTDSSISYAVVGTKANNPLGTCLLDCYLSRHQRLLRLPQLAGRHLRPQAHGRTGDR